MVEKPDGTKSEARLYQASLRKISVDECKMIQRIAQILEGMEDFCHSNKNMFLPIGEGIATAKEVIKKLGLSNENHESFLISLEYFLGLQVAKTTMKPGEKPESPRRARSEVVLIKPTEGI